MIQESHCPDSGELAALYACGAMSAAERQQFEAHLADGCLACRAELAEYGETVAGMLHAVEPLAPPPSLWARLRARIDAESFGDRLSADAREHALGNGFDHAPEGLRVIKAEAGAWSPTQYAGVELRVLHVDKQRQQFTALVRMAPGAVYPAHAHDGAEECLVLEGDLRFGDQILSRGDYLRTGPGYEQTSQTTEQGCLLYLSTPLE